LATLAVRDWRVPEFTAPHGEPGLPLRERLMRAFCRGAGSEGIEYLAFTTGLDRPHDAA
jgi:hypothetical protein